MSVHELYAQNNEKYASAFDKGSLPMPPAKHVAIGMLDIFTVLHELTRSHSVTCMDARVEYVQSFQTSATKVTDDNP